MVWVVSLLLSCCISLSFNTHKNSRIIVSIESTFIKVLTGEQGIDKGTIDKGETVVFGTYDQMGIDIDENQVVMNFVKENVEGRFLLKIYFI